jgi:hypothetical protein
MGFPVMNQQIVEPTSERLPPKHPFCEPQTETKGAQRARHPEVAEHDGSCLLGSKGYASRVLRGVFPPAIADYLKKPVKV